MNMLRGVIAAAATPLNSDLSIDLDRLVEHCRWLLGDGGCDGVNLLGTTGEATSFSTAQRVEAMHAVARAGLPLDRLMAGTGAAALDDAVRLTAEAKALGFAGALLLPPFYYKGINTAGLIHYVERLIRRVGADGLNLYLYHFPANSGVPYTIDAVVRLREAFPAVLRGLKDSSGDLDYSAALAKRLPGFDVLPSAEASLGRAAELGFAGCISATANVTGPFAQRGWSGKDGPQADGIAAATEIRAAIAKFPLVAAVKATLAMMTGETGWRRMMPPLTALTQDEASALRDALSATELNTCIGEGSGLAARSTAVDLSRA